ncbi:MAG: AAA family ATPase [bacterium]|nr:AAA family ATPase [bacterium]
MIRLVEALDFRCLRCVRRVLGDFQVLVGPNASGKTTFLEVVAFLGDLVGKGLDAAVGQRTQDFRDLVWQRTEGRFELAVELEIPPQIRKSLGNGAFSVVRYEVAVGLDETTQELSIQAEKVLVRESHREPGQQMRMLFPEPVEPPTTLLTPKRSKNAKTIVNKVTGGNDNFYDETGKSWEHTFRLGPRKSALANLPDDETRFPVSTWLKSLLIDGVQRLVLNSALMRKPSPPGQSRHFRPDGSNLPWVVEDLRSKRPQRHADWVEHLGTALFGIEDVRTIERPEDRHRYLLVRYRDGLEIPSWALSDGTLRLMALTLPAYLDGLGGIYLIEEPENGIHPRAVEALFQSLSSVYNAQILLATHSPVILSVARADQVLCFAKTDEGATDIVSGADHPRLREWRGESNLGVLFAGGVLG